MSLKLFEIFTSISNPYAIVDLKENDDEVFDYFLLNLGSDEKIKKKIECVAQEGYTPENIIRTDYLNSTTGGLIFSENFVDKFSDILGNELSFYPCSIHCQNQVFKFFISQVKFFYPIIDFEKSTYRELTNGKKIINTAVYRNNITDNFYIAKDIHSKVDIVVSDKFVELCKSNEIQIDFRVAKTM